jgi:hypothetical protein
MTHLCQDGGQLTLIHSGLPRLMGPLPTVCRAAIPNPSFFPVLVLVLLVVILVE